MVLRRYRFVIFFGFFLVLFGTDLFSETVIIDSVDILITGHTKEQAVRRYLMIEPGKRFETREEFEEFLVIKEQELKNARVFRESAIDYTLLEKTEDDGDTVLRIALAVHIIDGWTFYPIPLYQFSSSYGHMFMGVVYDTNLFGSMMNGLFILRYNRELFSTSLIVDEILLFGIPWKTMFRYEYVEQIKQEGDTITLQYDRKAVNLGVGAKPAIIGNLTYNFFPSLEYRFDYHVKSGEPDEAYIPPGVTINYNHTIGVDTVDWDNNFRKGCTISLNHIFGYTPVSGLITNKLRPELSGYTHADPLALSGRITGFGWLGGERTGAGKEMRGVIDNSLWGNWGMYGNGDIAMRLVTIAKALEIQIRTFTDIGFVKPKDEVLSAEDFQIAAGFGILVYPLVAPGMVINFGCGFNLTNPGEIEVTFNFREFY